MKLENTKAQMRKGVLEYCILPRKYYELTAKGRDFLNELEGSWGELVNAVRRVKTQRA